MRGLKNIVSTNIKSLSAAREINRRLTVGASKGTRGIGEQPFYRRAEHPCLRTNGPSLRRMPNYICRGSCATKGETGNYQETLYLDANGDRTQTLKEVPDRFLDDLDFDTDNLGPRLRYGYHLGNDLS